MTYVEWNEKLARHFFNPANAGKRIFLSIDDSLLERLGGPSGKDDFVAAVKWGVDPSRPSGFGVCTQAKRSVEEWLQNHSAGFPPFIAYLGLFVLAASEEGEEGQEGYHKRLRRLLDEKAVNNWLSNFKEMWTLWEALQMWANEELKGSLGVVNADFTGAWPHMGLPRAQIVLTDKERAHLPEVFSAAELDPTDVPTAESAATLICRHGKGLLEARTLRRLGKQGTFDTDVRSLLIEALLEELRSWDGSVESGHHVGSRFHALRINLKIKDRLGGIATSRIVVHDAPDFGDDGISVVSNGKSFAFTNCNADWLVLRDNDAKTIDASNIEWNAGFRATNGKTLLRLPPRKVRVFRKGEFDRIEGLIEINRLDPYREFYISASEDCAGAIEKWGGRAATKWEKVDLKSGLPKKTVLYRADKADPSIPAPAEYPALQVDSLVRIFLAGGIKSEPATRRYFDFAPPKIRIENLSPSSSVTINEVLYPPCDGGDLTVEVPPDQLKETNTVVVVTPAEVKHTRTFQIVSGKDIPWRIQTQFYTDPRGERLVGDSDQAKVTGAAVLGFDVPHVFMAPERRSNILGKKPGEIISFPDDAPPVGWEPVWIIEQGRANRRVIFCGTSVERCTPSTEKVADKKRVREWKTILWNERKKLLAPSRSPLSALWTKYKERAEHV